VLDVRLKPVETLLFRSDVVAIGKFRCPATNPLFFDSGPCSHHTFVFPRTMTLVRHAHRNKYAVVQINTNGGTYDITRAIIETAEAERAPVILGAYERNLAYRGYEYAAMQMRFFGGLSVDETAAVLGISAPSVLRDWKLARAWLMRELA